MMNFIDFIIPWAILFLGCIPLLALGYLIVNAHRRGYRLRTVLLGMTAVHEFLLIIFSAWYSGFNGFKLEAEFGGKPLDLLLVIVGEVLFVASFAAMFALNTRVGSPKLKTNCAISRNDSLLSYVLVLSGILSSVSFILIPGFSYHDMETHADIVVRTNIVDMVRAWIDGFISWPALIAAAMVAVSPPYPRLLRQLGIILVVLRLIISVVDGVRGGILLIFGLLVAFAFLASRKRLLAVIVLMVVLTVPILPWVQQIMRYETAASSALGVTRVEMAMKIIPLATDFLRGDVSLPREKSFVESWVDRAQGARNSITLYKLYGQDEGAGIYPLLGAFILPIPRAIWPNKPVAGSTDSTSLQAAIYQVQKPKPDTIEEEMGPITASAHAYWEGGLLWVILAGILTGFFWSSIIKWAEKTDSISGVIIVFGFMAALPIDGFYSMFNPLYTYVSLVWKLVIPLFLLNKVIQLIPRLRFTFNAASEIV